MGIIRCTARKHLREDERVVGECTEATHADHVHAVSHEGAVLCTYERNGYHDSDFYAMVFDAAANEVRTIEYGTTRGWTYHNGATVDADEATVEAAVAAQEPAVRERVRAKMEAEAAELTREARVEFTRAFNGKKQASVAKGATGTVFWTGPCRFNQHTTRVGVNLPGDGETVSVFVNANTLAVIEAPAIDTTELEARIAQVLANHRYTYTKQARKAVAA